ncbi:MAG: hypothetical protein GY751_23525 [Bacteroidetes bacterium]|nr:hypothetical protein [Bacteroidota bacterium]
MVKVSLGSYEVTDTVTVIVDPNENPNPEAGPDKEISLGESVTIGGDPDPTAFYYQWSTSLGDIAGANQSFLTANPTTDTWYFVSTYNQAGCIGRNSVQVQVQVNPVPPPPSIPSS